VSGNPLKKLEVENRFKTKIEPKNSKFTVHVLHRKIYY